MVSPRISVRKRVADGRHYSKIGTSLASTSSAIALRRLSSFLPLRAAKSRARGRSHRTTPIVLTPAPLTSAQNRRCGRNFCDS